MTWQKKARLAIAVFIIGFVAIVAVALRQRKPAEATFVAPPREDPVAVVENIGTGTFDRTKDGKLVFRIKFGSQFTYQDGRTKFGRGVEVTADRDGKPFTVTSTDAEVAMKDSDLDHAHFTGGVKLKSRDLEVAADDATYSESAGMVSIPGAVTFSRGRMTGSGVGATYDRNRDVLWLLDKAHIAVAADARGQGALEATAGSAGMARAEHYMKLINTGHIVAEGRVIDAGEITIMLTPDDERVQMLQLRGNSRITGGGAGSGPQAMSARDIDMTYGEDGRTLQHAQLVENAAVQLPGSAEAPGRKVSGKTIDIAMSPDGATVTNLNATENVQLDLPGIGDEPAKRIRSATLNAIGAPGAGLQNATFGGNVEYRETRPAKKNLPAIERTARSLKLVVDTKPGLGAVQKADFFGNVHFTDGTQFVADSSHALYLLDRDQIDLSPTPDPGPPTPRMSDGRVTVEARTISFTLASRKLNADTKVRSSMLPQPKPAAAAARGSAAPAPPAEQGHIPSLLKQDQAVTVSSNRMEYDGAAGHAIYSGNAKLWQADTSVRGDTIVVDDKTGNLEASGTVRTEMMLDDVNAKTGERKAIRTTAESETFVYDDAKRLATYTGKAHMIGREGDVTAEKLELYLKPGGNELERAEGYGANGNVVVKETGRVVTGQRLTYTAKTEIYVMTGTPVVAIKTTPPDCDRSEGARLTFQRGEIGTGSIEGNGPIRTSHKPIECPAERR